MEMPGVLLKCFLTKNISTCANKRIPRKALKRKFFLSSGKNINSFLLFVLTLIEREMLFVRRARRWGLEKPICKTECHDDSKTISWHAAFPVRFARRLAALRLNSPLRGSDSGSLGRQHRKPHDGSLATVRAICFRIHHGCIILRTIFYDTVRLHIAKSSWLAGGRLSGTVLSCQITKHEKTETL